MLHEFQLNNKKLGKIAVPNFFILLAVTGTQPMFIPC